MFCEPLSCDSAAINWGRDGVYSWKIYFTVYTIGGTDTVCLASSSWCTWVERAERVTAKKLADEIHHRGL